MRGFRGACGRGRGARELTGVLAPWGHGGFSHTSVQDREDQEFDVPFIIGLTCDVGNGTCIVKEHTEREYVNGTRFDAGEAAVAIRWCDTDHVSHLPECAMRDQLVLEQQADAACMYAVM